jgi:hypothetical protein
VTVGDSFASCRVALLFQGSDFYLIRRPGRISEQILLSADVVVGLVIRQTGAADPCP